MTEGEVDPAHVNALADDLLRLLEERAEPRVDVPADLSTLRTLVHRYPDQARRFLGEAIERRDGEP